MSLAVAVAIPIQTHASPHMQPSTESYNRDRVTVASVRDSRIAMLDHFSTHFTRQNGK